MLSDRGYFGLKLSIIPLYGNIRTEDGEMYELLRNPGGNSIYSAGSSFRIRRLMEKI